MLRDLFSLFPAHAGVILGPGFLVAEYLSFPRTCGGDPGIDVDLKTAQGFSPHTRGLQKRTTGATKNEMIFLERRTLQFYRPPRL